MPGEDADSTALGAALAVEVGASGVGGVLAVGGAPGLGGGALAALGGRAKRGECRRSQPIAPSSASRPLRVFPKAKRAPTTRPAISTLASFTVRVPCAARSANASASWPSSPRFSTSCGRSRSVSMSVKPSTASAPPGIRAATPRSSTASSTASNAASPRMLAAPLIASIQSDSDSMSKICPPSAAVSAGASGVTSISSCRSDDRSSGAASGMRTESASARGPGGRAGSASARRAGSGTADEGRSTGCSGFGSATAS